MKNIVKLAPQQQQEQHLYRPTEAQLRWAQFHRKQRVKQVEERVERLWQTPASVSSVEGALSQDGASTSSGSCCSAVRARKPKISRGRRAMLRVSRRAYESRRIRIQNEGFYAFSTENEQDDELAHLMEEHVVKRRKRNRRSHGSHSEEDRVRRFEAAYLAMMTNLTQAAPVTIESSKRWTRPVQVSSPTIDEYDDFNKWGFTSNRHLKRAVASPTTPVDRRATWLVHLPHRQPSSSSSLLMRRFSKSSSPRTLTVDAGSTMMQPPPCSPGKAKFDELVKRMQNPSLYGNSASLLSPEYRQEFGYTVGSTPRKRLSPEQREPFLTKLPNESERDFERRREYFKRRELKLSPMSESQRDFEERKHCFERRHVRRSVPRTQFFQALQAPYTRSRRGKRLGTLPARGKRLSSKQRQRFDASQVPKLCRKQGTVRSPSVGARVGGLLKMFDTTVVEQSDVHELQLSLFPNDDPEEVITRETPVAELRSFFLEDPPPSAAKNMQQEELRALAKMANGRDMNARERGYAARAYRRMVQGKGLTAEQDVSFRKFCSSQHLDPQEATIAATAYHKVVSGRGITPKQEMAFQKLVSGDVISDEHFSDASVAYQKLMVPSKSIVAATVVRARRKRALAALGKFAKGLELSSLEKKDARNAVKSLMTAKQLTPEEEHAFEEWISEDALSEDMAELAVSAYSKVVTGLTSEEENAFGDLVEGQRELTAKEADLALDAYCKLTADDEEEDEEAYFAALRKLSAGYCMTPDEEVQAVGAYHIMTRNLSSDREEACRKLVVAGEALSSTDEDLATAAYKTLVGGIHISSTQEAAFRKVVTGDIVSDDEEVQALAVWRELMKSKDAQDDRDYYASEEEDDEEEDYFESLRKLAAGFDLTPAEEKKAADAYRDVVSGVYLNGAQRASFQKFVSGQELDLVGTQHAVTAYHKLVTVKQLLPRQEVACRKMFAGEALTDEEAGHAREGYQQLVFAKITAEEKAAFPRDYSSGEFVERQAYFELRNSHRRMSEKRHLFFQELEAPHTSAQHRRDAKGKERTSAAKRLSKEKQTVDVSTIPKLIRKNRDAFISEEPNEPREKINRMSLSIGTKVGGLLGVLSASNKSLGEDESPSRVQKLHRSLFHGVMGKAEKANSFAESPLASFRNLFSGNKKGSPSSTDSPKSDNGSDEDALELMAFGKMASGGKMTTQEQVFAATAYQKMVCGKSLTEEQDLLFQRYVSQQDLLDATEAGQAAIAYRKVVSGKDLTGKEEAAIRMLVEGEELSDDQAIDALEGYRKLTHANFAPERNAASNYRSVSQATPKEEVTALGKLSAGLEMTQTEKIRARDALQKMILGKQITLDQEYAYRRFVSGEQLTAQEEEVADLAFHKVFFCAGLTESEELSLERLITGEAEEMNAEETTQAVLAYEKISIPREIEENEDSFFAALRKLSGGYMLTDKEKVQAAAACQKIVAGKPLSIDQEAAYRTLVCGGSLAPSEKDVAMDAHQALANYACLTNAEEGALGKVIAGGEELNVEDLTHAKAAYKKLVSVPQEAEDENEDSFFAALRKLSGGYVLTDQEKSKADAAFQKMIDGKPLSSEQAASYQKLAFGGTLTAAEVNLATDAYRTVVKGAHLTVAEEDAFRKVLTGENPTSEDELHAKMAFCKMVSSHDEQGSQTGDEDSVLLDSIAGECSNSLSDVGEDGDFFSALRKLAAGYDMSVEEEMDAAVAYQMMDPDNKLDKEQGECFQMLVSGQDLSPIEASHAATAYHLVVYGKGMTDKQEAGFRKLVSGEHLSNNEVSHAFQGYRKVIRKQTEVDNEVASGKGLARSSEQELQEVSALGKLAAGAEMSPEEKNHAQNALYKMFLGKQMTPDEEGAYRMLVKSPDDLTDDEQELALIGYQKIVSGRGLTNDEKDAYLQLIDGEDLTSEGQAHALSAYKKLVSNPLERCDDGNIVRAVSALHALAAGLKTSDETELQAVVAYQSMVAGKHLTRSEDASYRKLVCGTALTSDEEDQASAAYNKVLQEVDLSHAEEGAFRKLLSGQDLAAEEDFMLAVSAFSKIASDALVDGDPLTLYQKFSAGENLAPNEEIQAVAAFKRIQEERRACDGSTSSFRPLPDGILRVVQSFASPQSLEEEEYFEENEDHVASAHSEQPIEVASSFSPSRSRMTRPGVDELTPEQMKSFQQKLIAEGDMDQTIIDTDDTTSDASGAKMDPTMAASLMLSPTILTKRHQQAIRAIEKRKWDQVSYILNANPWLAEMTDVMTNQYLLHKLSFYGASVVDVDSETGEVRRVDAPAAPEQLNQDMIRMFPSSVHKFDQDGNLPLHMAAASGNVTMIKLLGERFPSGASVRNNDGYLPLHLAIMSCSSPISMASENTSTLTEAIRLTLKLFPQAVGVTDNEGNLPLHTAASTLQGDVGVDAIYILLDEADQQESSGCLRFSEFKQKHEEDDSVHTDITSANTDSETVSSDTLHCAMVRNNDGHNPLITAIRSMAGWEVVEAIVGGAGGRQAALYFDANKCTALHLLVSGEFADPPSILSILKAVPQAAAIRNGAGVLPIEAACMQRMPREVILALVLVDLPLDLDEKDGVKVRDGFGRSWWFLTCECDDHHVDIVEEVISICSYSQIRELCFMKGGANGNDGPVISRATPKCRFELRKALRFVGRFEFLGSSALHVDPSLGLKIFEALDFGTEELSFQEGRRMLLYCYGSEDTFRNETLVISEHDFDNNLVEEVFDFAVHELDNQNSRGAPQQFCVAVERPNLTLDKVALSMSSNREYQLDSEMRGRYLAKVCSVLRSVAKAILHLHLEGVVHSTLCLQNCGKFEDKWKVMGMMGAHNVGAVFDPSTMGVSLPPECVEVLSDVVETHSRSASRRATVKSRFVAETSIDFWGFGKLAYEVLTGEPLIQFDLEKETRRDNRALRTLLNWNESNIRVVIDSLERAGVPSSGADLVARCLLPNFRERPTSMNDVLEHEFWSDMRRNGGGVSKAKAHSRRHGNRGKR